MLLCLTPSSSPTLDQPLSLRRRFFEHRIHINYDYLQAATNNAFASSIAESSSHCTTIAESNGSAGPAQLVADARSDFGRRFLRFCGYSMISDLEQ